MKHQKVMKAMHTISYVIVIMFTFTYVFNYVFGNEVCAKSIAKLTKQHGVSIKTSKIKNKADKAQRSKKITKVVHDTAIKKNPVIRRKSNEMVVIVTAYTTRKKECGNNKSITASGRKAIPWMTASVGDDVAYLFNKKKPVKIKVRGFTNTWTITDRKKKGRKGIDLCVGKGTPADVKIAKEVSNHKRVVTLL